MNSLPSTATVVIIGAGVIGCSTAYHLARKGITDIVVLEMNQVGSGTSSKSASMLSPQYPHDAIGLRMVTYSFDRFMAFEEELGVPIDYKPIGRLALAQASEVEAMRQHVRILQKEGIAIEFWTPEEVLKHYPGINVRDIELVTWGPDDGPCDPHMIMWGYVQGARSKGAKVLEGIRATDIVSQGGRIQAVETTHGRIATAAVVNAAGPWAPQVASWLGVDVPQRNAIRGVIVTDPVPGIPRNWPFIDDVSQGWYCRPEGEGVLMGMGIIPTSELVPYFSEALMDDMINAASHRIPFFQHASLQTKWAGIRPLSPDNHPILGPVAGIEGFFLNCAWGGAGIMQAPIAGEVLAALIDSGTTDLVDITPLSLDRFGT